SISARFCGTCSDGHSFSPVRRQGHDKHLRCHDLRSVHELRDLNVLQQLLPHDVLLSNSRVLRRHSVLCGQSSLGDAHLEANAR
ncbi:MAG: hypothetical protein WB581_03010, partial [Halobacteriota archaeon]